MDGIVAEVQRRFGVTPRPPQIALIERSLAGQSSLGVMPTGSGKSLAYQAAAALLPGTVLVVSPLISLMRDQVSKLQGTIRAERLDSTLEPTESRRVLQALWNGQIDLLYVAPERLSNERFRRALHRTRVPLLAVDEAHCISAWGHDFRPDYLRLPILRSELGDVPVLALTATAPPHVREDITRTLAIPAEGVVDTGARRPELSLRVEVPADRERRLVELVTAEPDSPTIVYALRQAHTLRLAELLRAHGVRAEAYHAGLDDERRSAVQDDFMADRVACVVATIAFGMGVDKPNVRRVIHAHAPRSVEGFAQEVGRAGRDGQPATATLLFQSEDIPALANFVEALVPSDEQVRGVLNAGFGMRESSDTLAISPYGLADMHDVTSEAVRTLFARLELMGILEALTPARETYQMALTADVGAIGRALGDDGDVWVAMVASSRAGRTLRTFQLTEIAAAGIDRASALRVFRRLEEEGLATVSASGVLLRYRVLRRPNRDLDTPALLASVHDALEGERRRLAAVVSYVGERVCRQAHVLAYLGDVDLSPCGVCDLCRGAPPVEPGEPRGWIADESAIRTLGEIETDDIGIARALCQVSSTRSRKYRRSPFWGVAERAPYIDVLVAVRRTLSPR
jgi:ATP-dependent DNA helicase RecQ